MARGKTGATLLVVLAAFVVLSSGTAAAQCAMCRRALESPEGQQMIAAFRSGILVLLAAPFAVFATVATLAVRRFRGLRMIEGDDSADGRPHRSRRA